MYRKSADLPPAREDARMSVVGIRIGAEAVHNSHNLCTAVDDTPTRYGMSHPQTTRYIVVTRLIGILQKMLSAQ